MMMMMKFVFQGILLVALLSVASCFMKQDECPSVEPMLDFNVTGITGTWYLVAMLNSSKTEMAREFDFEEYRHRIPEYTCARVNIDIVYYSLKVSQNWIRCDNQSVDIENQARLDSNCAGYFYPDESEFDLIGLMGVRIKKIVTPVGVVVFTDYDKILVTYVYSRINNFLYSQCQKVAYVLVRDRSINNFAEIYSKLHSLNCVGFELSQLELIKNDETCTN
jgi:uncharacterized ubiquitin-like protein YukD